MAASRPPSYFRFWTVVLAAGGFISLPLPAMTVRPMSFDSLLREAEQIYKAQVMSVRCDWSGEGANRHPATFVRLRVLQSFRGGASGVVTLELFGGTIGTQTHRILGMPQFHVGDVEILFVQGNGVYQCPLVGVHQGRFSVVKNAADGGEHVYLSDGSPLTEVSRIGLSPEVHSLKPGAMAGSARVKAMSAKDFGKQIRAGLAERGITGDEP